MIFFLFPDQIADPDFCFLLISQTKKLIQYFQAHRRDSPVAVIKNIKHNEFASIGAGESLKVWSIQTESEEYRLSLACKVSLFIVSSFILFFMMSYSSFRTLCIFWDQKLLSGRVSACCSLGNTCKINGATKWLTRLGEYWP